jgi:hypothetical protein
LNTFLSTTGLGDDEKDEQQSDVLDGYVEKEVLG